MFFGLAEEFLTITLSRLRLITDKTTMFLTRIKWSGENFVGHGKGGFHGKLFR
jgi:hypothetical protein